MQCLPSERGIAVHGDLIRANLGHGDQDRTLLRARFELHAGYDVDIGRKRIARHLLDELLMTRTIALFGHDVGGERIAQLLAFQCLLQAGHDVAGAMQITQRRVGRGAVQHLAVVVGKGVVNGRNATLADFHWKPP